MKTLIKRVFWKVAVLLLSDKQYLRLKYRRIMKQPLHLRHPLTYAEKMQWLKLYNRNPIYTTMVDKLLVKDYVASIIGQDHVIPTIAVWNAPDEIDFDLLPNQFVLKCNHNSGSGVIICKDKNTIDNEAIREKIRSAYDEDYYSYNREWPYKNVEKKVFAEELLIDEHCSGDATLADYKFFCFNGEPKVMYISNDASSNVYTDFFDMNFKHLPISMRDKNSNLDYEIPKCFDEMKKIACVLSKGIPHVRVDFYEVNGRVYFGEMTFFHCGGFVTVQPEEWDKQFADWITIC